MTTLYASELSSCVGKNKYQSVNDAKMTIWKRWDEWSFKAAHERAKFKHVTPEIVLKKLPVSVTDSVSKAVNVKSEDEATRIVEKLMKSPANNPTSELIDQFIKCSNDKTTTILELCEKNKVVGSIQIASNVEKLGEEKLTKESIKNIFDRINVGDVKEARESVVHAVNTKRGIENEGSATKMYEDVKRVKVSHRNDRFLKVKIGNTPRGNAIYVGGKVDGITPDRVIEVKCRRNRFFDTIPEYEKVQIHAYMAVTGLFKTDHIQKYNNETRTTVCEFDPCFWDEVCDIAVHFVNEMHLILENQCLQDELIKYVSETV